MSEITVKDMCPHCGRETIVWLENEDGVMRFRGCQHCDKTLGDLSWRKRAWLVARELRSR